MAAEEQVDEPFLVARRIARVRFERAEDDGAGTELRHLVDIREGRPLFLDARHVREDAVGPRRRLQLLHRVFALADAELVGPRLDEQHVVLVAHRHHAHELLGREVGEPEIRLERTAVVRHVDVGITHLAAPVAADLLVGHVVIDARELLVVLQIDAELDREVVLLVRLVVDPGLTDLEELLQVLVELGLGHALPLAVPFGREGSRSARSCKPIGYLRRVSLAEPATGSRLRSEPRTAAQVRIITAALDLFAEHGVNGTSLQMIADAIGVTKAAIYHQFKTKEEIVLAAVEVELAKLETALDAADAEDDLPRARELVLTQVIDLAVERRSMVSAVQHDPVIVRVLARHEPFRRLMDRLFIVLTGGDADADARVRAAMVSAAIGGAVTHPLVVDLDDETLRSELLTHALALLGIDASS